MISCLSSTKFREQGYGQDVDKSLLRPPDRLQFESVLRPLRSGKGCGSQSVPPLPPLSHGQDQREEVNVGFHPGNKGTMKNHIISYNRIVQIRKNHSGF